jgi:hypothetical protein
MDKNQIHPMYKILAVLCVGSVAKALFSESRVPQAVYSVGTKIADTAAERVIKGS